MQAHTKQSILSASQPAVPPSLLSCSVLLTFLPLISVFAEAVIQVFLVAVDGRVGSSQAVPSAILESSWFGEVRVSWEFKSKTLEACKQRLTKLYGIILVT